MRSLTSAIHREKVCSTKRNLCSVKRKLFSTVSEESIQYQKSYIWSKRTVCVVGGESLHYQEFHICSANRESVHYQKGRICRTRRRLYSVRRQCIVSGGLHLQ